MHELIRLLTEFGADQSLIDLAQRWVDRAEEATVALDDTELETLQTGLVALAEDDTTGLALLEEAATLVDEIRTEVEARETAAADEDAAIAAQRARLRGEDPEADADGGDGDEDADADADGDADSESGDGDAETPAEDADADADADTREPVTAGAAPNRAARRALRRRTPSDAQARVAAEPGARFFVAGREVDGFGEIDRELVSRVEGFRLQHTGVDSREHVRVASIRPYYPPERTLTTDSARNTEIISTVLRDLMGTSAARARVASGGLCGPLTPYYGVDVLGDDSQPVRDTALVSFSAGAARGGMISMAPPILPQLAGSATIWTEENDADPGSDGPSVKPCLRVECGSERTTKIHAVPICLEIGNFMQRTFGEWVDAWSELSLVNAARVKEQDRLADIEAFSTKPTAIDTQWSASIDLLTVIDQATAGFRSRHRLPRTFPMRVILPEVVLTIIRTDIARAMRTGSLAENFALAESEIVRWFTARNINVTWSPDMNVMGPQASATPLATLPPTIEMALYPEGTFLYLDGGELNLGVVRDSTLIGTNDAQTFAEIFDGVHPIGVESQWLTINLCPSGAMSGTIDPAAYCSSYT